VWMLKPDRTFCASCPSNIRITTLTPGFSSRAPSATARLLRSSPVHLLTLGMVKRLRHIPHKLRRVEVTQHLAYGVGFTRTVEIMVDVPQERRANALDARFTLPLQASL
jgi:hypothetical protein